MNLISETMKNLKKNNMQAFYVETRKDVIPKIKELLNDGDSVSVGGSVTLAECGVIDFLKCGNYDYIDRYAEGLTRIELDEVFHKALLADAYITSSNAVTKCGKLYNVDGRGNRIGALCFGPKNVIVVVGKNKIKNDIFEAEKRVKCIAAPNNCRRLNMQTYCSKTDKCAAGDKMFEGCESPDRICATYMITARQRDIGRIKVIIVGENLGY